MSVQAQSGAKDFARAITATPGGLGTGDLGAPPPVVMVHCFRGRVRLSRESLRDLQNWRAMTTGDGRELKHTAPTMGIHTDAVNLGYGDTLGRDIKPGAPGLWEAQDIWSAADRAHMSVHLFASTAFR